MANRKRRWSRAQRAKHSATIKARKEQRENGDEFYQVKNGKLVRIYPKQVMLMVLK